MPTPFVRAVTRIDLVRRAFEPEFPKIAA